MHLQRLLAFAAAVVMIMAALPLAAQHPPRAVLLSGGTWIDLGLPPGALWAGALSINDSGTIAGWGGWSTAPYLEAFQYASGVMLAVVNLGFGEHINSGGSIAGTTAFSRAFRYDSDGSVHYPFASDVVDPSFSTGINSAGTLVGYVTVGPGPGTHAFVTVGLHSFSYTTSGTVTDLGLWAVTDINSSGVMTGLTAFNTAPGLHILKYVSGTITDLGAPVSPCISWPRINDANVIAAGGDYYDTAFHAIPLLPGDLCTQATGINNGSPAQIVGLGQHEKAWMYTIGGSLVDLGTAKQGGGQWFTVTPRHINGSGQVVGEAF